MANGWKKFESDSAALFNVHRCWANSGERLDFPQTVELTKSPVRGQCKLVKSLSLNGLTRLCEEVHTLAKSDLTVTGCFGVVCTKVRRGRGQESEPIIAMTFEAFKQMRKHYLSLRGNNESTRMDTMGSSADKPERELYSSQPSKK